MPDTPAPPADEPVIILPVAPPTVETTVTYTPRLARRITGRVLRGSFGWAGLGFTALFVALDVWMLLSRPGATAYFLSGFAACLILIGVLAHVSLIRQTTAVFRGKPNLTLRMTFDDTGYSLREEDAALSVRWSTVKELRRYRDVWLLMVTKQVFRMLPVESLNDPLRAFIVAKVTQHGGRIR